MPHCIVYDDEGVDARAYQTENRYSSTSATSHSFTACNFDVPAANRRIAVSVTFGATVTSVTIGGVAATLVASNTYSRLYVATVPSGATGTVVVTKSASGPQGIGVWAIQNTLSATPYDTAADDGSIPVAVTTLNLPIDCPAGGCVIGFGIVSGQSGPPSSVWSNLTETSNRLDTWLEATLCNDNFASAQVNRAVSFQMTGTVGSLGGALVASFA